MEVLVVPAHVHHPEGPEVVRKTASLPGERARLLREAEVLATAGARGVPGLPAVISQPSEDVAEPCLVTSAVAGPSLALAAPLPALEVAGVAAEVARLLAGLHEAGLVHGAVEPSHVVLDGCGGAILVGLGNGGPIGCPAADPADGHLDPASDVAAWGLLVGHLLDWSATRDDEPLLALRQALATRRARRLGRGRPAARGDEDERRVLAALADQAQDPDPARRPSARALAAAVTHRIPEARVPGAVPIASPLAPATTGLLERLTAHVGVGAPSPGTAPAAPADGQGGGEPSVGRRRRPTTARSDPLVETRPPPSAPRDRAAPPASGTEAIDAPAPREPEGRRTAWRRWTVSQHRWILAAGGVAIALLAVRVASGGILTPERTMATSGGGQPSPACPAATAPAADVDGDGCEEPVRWIDGVLHAGSARFALGIPGDSWAVGDWDCDGRRTPAVLHRGALSVFDAWPAHGGELLGRLVATPGASVTGLTVVAGPGGCDRLVLTRTGGADLAVDVRGAP